MMSRPGAALTGRPTALPGLEFAPGTNRSDRLARADWRFLLPDLQPTAVLALGPIDAPSLTVLASAGASVVVLLRDVSAWRRLRDACERGGIANARGVVVGPGGRLPIRPGCVDLIVSVEATDVLPWNRHLLTEIVRALRPGGALCRTERGRTLRLADTRSAERALGLRAAGEYRELRRRDRTLLAFQADAPGEDVRFFFRRVLHPVSTSARLLGAGARLATRFGATRFLASATTRILRFEAGGSPARGPAGAMSAGFGHLDPALRRAGLRPEDFRVAFFARGEYDSNKVSFYLFPRVGGEPNVIVKMPRSARFNHRLDTEFRALTALRELVPEGTCPAPLFLDHHAELAVLGEEVVAGVPFRRLTTARADCPFADRALDWLIGLGVTSRRAGRTPDGQASRIGDLFDRYLRIYEPGAAERRSIDSAIAPLLRGDGAVPTVFRHSDAGTWNVLASRDGRIVFLDWETSEPAGMPLWDLFDFLGSFALWSGRTRGCADPCESYARAFHVDGPFRALHDRAVEKYCARVGVNGALGPALFAAFWMQRAVREATWTKRPLSEGTYARLLRLNLRAAELGDGIRFP